MEKISFDYSIKNIAASSEKQYKTRLLGSSEHLMHNMRWRAYHFLKPKKHKQKLETYGFKSRLQPEIIKELKPFEDRLLQLVRNIEFKPRSNDFQQRLREDIKESINHQDIIVKADKTSNFYRMEPKEYQRLLDVNIQDSYKKAPADQAKTINKEAKRIADLLKLSDRIDMIAEREAYILLKDHKPNFANERKCRLINPCKGELGKISKKLLEKMVRKTVTETKVNLWRNTQEVLQWFDNIQHKESASFISFDIVGFYPAISKTLFEKALKHAEKYSPLSALEKEVISHSKKTLLFSNSIPWQKKGESDFDITMGSHDGAECCELVGCYLLSQLKAELGDQVSLGLYRDDGLAVTHASPRDTENMKKVICKVFKNNGLQITIQANKKVVDFLDVTLNLETKKYHPFLKPGNTPVYINSKSNHPPSIKKAVPLGINKRLCDISSDEVSFKNHTKVYQEALQKSGFKHKLVYTPKSPPAEATASSTKRKRRRRVTWFNPPFDMQVKTPIGQKFRAMVEECFPKGHKLRKIFNKNTL